MKRKSNKKHKGKRLTIFIIFIFFTIFIIVNDFGVIQLAHLKREQHTLEQDVSQLQRQQINLNNEIENLKTNTDYIEKIAREKFMMAKPGEKIFRVIEYKTIQ